MASREQGARGREQGAKSEEAKSEEHRESESKVRGQRSAVRRTNRIPNADFIRTTIKVKAEGLRNRWSSEKIRPMEEKRKTLSARLARWAAELVLVFIGVYAAFWLNSYQQRQQDAERRDRILASIEQTLREGIESSKINRAEQQEPAAAEFRRALDAGEMPPLRPFVFITDYSPSDLATMLQSGGVQLLDLQTLRALRNDESVIRWGLARMARYQKLSDELIVPNLTRTFRSFTIRPPGNCENGSRYIPKLSKQQ